MSADPCGCDLTAKIPHRCERHQEEFDTQSPRIFYHTTFRVETVSERDITWPSTCTFTDTEVALQVKIEKTGIDAVTAVRLLKIAGVDPARLWLTPDGKDISHGE